MPNSTSHTCVSILLDEDIAVITLDSPPVNSTTLAVRAELLKAVDTVIQSGAHAAVFCCAGRTFIAGGDLTEFDHPPVAPHLPDVVNAIEASVVPWVAALHGNCLGGGVEVALGCSVRVAAANTKIGMPEVSVGVIPGAGGTQRLPRLVGVEAATEIISSGTPISAERALELGLVDQIAENDLLEAAKQVARDLDCPRRISTFAPPLAPKAGFFDEMRVKLTQKAKDREAPQKAIDVIERTFTLAFTDGSKSERKVHLALRDSNQSRALRHAFFAERAVARPVIIEGGAALPLNKIAIVGGGLMGSGIATALLLAGYSVLIVERNEASIATARRNMDDLLAGAHKRGKLDDDSLKNAQSRLSIVSDYAATGDADLAIEAVFEDVSVKQDVFQNLARFMRNTAIIATNTSYLNPLDIAKNISNPERIIGLHFFSPAHIMKLLEVVQTPQTSVDVMATGFALAKRLRKIAVPCGICDGFIGNRILASYRRQADYLLEDGANPAGIDAAMRAFGLPLGPYELQDRTGLQIGWANRKRLAPTRAKDERYVKIADRLCELERFGKRSGRGWYDYSEDGQKSDPVVEAIIGEERTAKGINPREFSIKDIQDRTVAAMINEAAHILDEGVAARPLDIDMAKIHGYGFPRHRGGPLFHADLVGLKTILAHVEMIAEENPGSWTVSPLLIRLVSEGKSFNDLN